MFSLNLLKRTLWLFLLNHVTSGQVQVGLIACRQKMFGNSGRFGFNVSFVDRTSMFIESVFEKQIYIFPLSYLTKIITLLTHWFWILGNDDVTCNPRLRECDTVMTKRM